MHESLPLLHFCLLGGHVCEYFASSQKEECFFIEITFLGENSNGRGKLQVVLLLLSTQTLLYVPL